MSQFDLTGKVAIVTGSSRGSGRASAFELAEHGAKPVISSRNQDACDAVAAEMNARFGAATAIAVAANISDKAALHRAGLHQDRFRARFVGGPGAHRRGQRARAAPPDRRAGGDCRRGRVPGGPGVELHDGAGDRGGRRRGDPGAI